jgi:hypothetical protein
MFGQIQTQLTPVALVVATPNGWVAMVLILLTGLQHRASETPIHREAHAAGSSHDGGHIAGTARIESWGVRMPWEEKWGCNFAEEPAWTLKVMIECGCSHYFAGLWNFQNTFK